MNRNTAIFENFSHPHERHIHGIAAQSPTIVVKGPKKISLERDHANIPKRELEFAKLNFRS